MKYKIYNVLSYVVIFSFLTLIVFYAYTHLSNGRKVEQLDKAISENTLYLYNNDISLIRDFYKFHTITSQSVYETHRANLNNSVDSSVMSEYYPKGYKVRDATNFYIEDILIREVTGNEREYRVLLAFANDINVIYSEVYITIVNGSIQKVNSRGVVKQ